jgi:2-oxo-4-hydroxy-4-carboxy-5-ureidoimidazoline decarboxylase
MDALRNKYAVSANREQGQITDADEVTLTELAELNQQYLADHGFIFIVCATGKSALEMLGLLKSRIDNTREQEIENAAREQGEITLLRIEKLLRQ